MEESTKAWESLFGHGWFADAHDAACAAKYYGAYPGELADELAADAAKIQDDIIDGFNDNMHSHIMSPLFNGREFWRVFMSFHPTCPLNPAPFYTLEEAVWSRDKARFRDCWKLVKEEISVFGVWMEATELWKIRPNEEESLIHCERREILDEIVKMNPGLKAKGEPDSVMKRFRETCKSHGLPGIQESGGLAMIREIKSKMAAEKK